MFGAVWERSERSLAGSPVQPHRPTTASCLLLIPSAVDSVQPSQPTAGTELVEGSSFLLVTCKSLKSFAYRPRCVDAFLLTAVWPLGWSSRNFRLEFPII